MKISRDDISIQAKLASDIDKKDWSARFFCMTVIAFVAFFYGYRAFIPFIYLYFFAYEAVFAALRRALPDNSEYISTGLLVAMTLRVPIALTCVYIMTLSLAAIPTHGALLASLLLITGIILNTLVGHGSLPVFPWLNIIPTAPALGCISYLAIIPERQRFMPYEVPLILVSFVFFAIGIFVSLQRQSEARGKYAEALQVARDHLQELDRLARRDSLTGIMNRFAFDEALVAAHSSEQALAIIVVDLNKFKPINDTYGHSAGDEVLKIVAERLTNALPAGTVGRMGGDEFAVFLAGAHVRDAAKYMQRIKDCLTVAVSIEGHIVEIGSAVGLAIRSHPTESPDALYSRADQDMYRNKP